MTPLVLADEFAVRIYSAPLAQWRDSGRIRDLSDPVAVGMLIVDFVTEVEMNGMADFLGNGTGRFARETIEALKLIGCEREGSVLREIVATAEDAGMTRVAVQQDLSTLEPYTVASFRELHGDKWDAALERIHTLEPGIDTERVRDRIAPWVERHRTAFERALEQSP